MGIIIKLTLCHARLTAVDRQKNRSRLTSEADSPRLLHCNASPPLSDYDDEDAFSLSASEQWSGGTLGLSLTLQLTYISIVCTLQASLSCRGNLFYLGKLTRTVQDKALPTKQVVRESLPAGSSGIEVELFTKGDLHSVFDSLLPLQMKITMIRVKGTTRGHRRHKRRGRRRLLCQVRLQRPLRHQDRQQGQGPLRTIGSHPHLHEQGTGRG